MSISPWDDSVTSPSPDGRVVARISDATEIAMGAPTSGELVLSNGIRCPMCNPSLVWSDDSEYLAVPQWTRDRRQRLLIISMTRCQSHYAPEVYQVLELHSFSGGIVRGVDSPVYMPQDIEVDIRRIQW